MVEQRNLYSRNVIQNRLAALLATIKRIKMWYTKRLYTSDTCTLGNVMFQLKVENLNFSHLQKKNFTVVFRTAVNYV